MFLAGIRLQGVTRPIMEAYKKHWFFMKSARKIHSFDGILGFLERKFNLISPPFFIREDLFITSKLWNEYHKPEDVEAACRQSLSNLGLQSLDLYLMHWPFAFERQHPNGIHPVDFNHKVSYLQVIHLVHSVKKR